MIFDFNNPESNPGQTVFMFGGGGEEAAAAAAGGGATRRQTAIAGLGGRYGNAYQYGPADSYTVRR